MTLHVAFLVFVSWDFCCFDSVVVVVVGGGGRGGRQERVCLGVEGGGRYSFEFLVQFSLRYVIMCVCVCVCVCVCRTYILQINCTKYVYVIGIIMRGCVGVFNPYTLWARVLHIF